MKSNQHLGAHLSGKSITPLLMYHRIIMFSIFSYIEHNITKYLVIAINSLFIFFIQDLIVHVTDSSHPEYELQKKTVEEVLDRMLLSEPLRESMVVVLNKADLG